MPSLRQAIQSTKKQEDTNIGLWLDRYFDIPDKDDDEKAGRKQQHLKEARSIGLPVGYCDFLKNRSALFSSSKNTSIVEAESIGRLAIGLGESSSWENNVRLQHTWGLPMIPGSALKGLAATFAHRYLRDPQWRRDVEEQIGGESHHLLFGTTDWQGLVTFHDALWIPPQAGGNGLVLDTITVHHQKYYQEGASEPPADWDSPVPIPFLAVVGKFEFALSGPKEWVDAAYALLELALRHIGIGAKTSSGYGRMKIKRILSLEEQRFSELKHLVDDFTFPTQPGEINQIKTRIQKIWHVAEDEQLRIEYLSLFYERVNSAEKKIRQTVKKYLKEKLPQQFEEGKQIVERIYDEVFVSQPSPQQTRKEAEKQQPEIEVEKLKELAKSFLAEILKDVPSKGELEEILFERVPSFFDSLPSKAELNAFLKQIEQYVNEHSCSGKEKKLIRDTSKKMIKKFFK